MHPFFYGLSIAIVSKIFKYVPDSRTEKKFKFPNEDAKLSSSTHHTVIYEDAGIRVLDETVHPKEKENLHRHEFPSIVYIDKPAAIGYYGDKKRPTAPSWTSSNPSPSVQFIKEEEPHLLQNLDTKPYGCFRIEIKSDLTDVANLDQLARDLEEVINSHKENFDKEREEILKSYEERKKRDTLDLRQTSEFRVTKPNEKPFTPYIEKEKEQAKEKEQPEVKNNQNKVTASFPPKSKL